MTVTLQQAKPLALTQLGLYQFAIDLDKPLPVGKQRIEQRSGLVLVAQTEERQEWVEISPLCGVDNQGEIITGFSQESLEEVSQQLLTILPQLQQQPIDCLLEHAEQSTQPSLAYGLSLMHAKLMGKLDGHSLTARTVPLIYRQADEPLSLVASRVNALPETTLAVKVKVAQDSLEDELQLIHQILAIRPKLKLRLDANRGFSLEQAIEFAACVPLESIEYIEEPCQNPQDNCTFYQAIEMPWALDESLNHPDYQFEMLPGLRALLIKPTLFGSLEKLQQLIDTAAEHGVRTILSSSLEASLGIEAISRLAQIFTPDETPGIDTLGAFNQDLLVSSGKDHCLKLAALTPLFILK
ncbi:o-succinylbenzoate synthase [Shewanella schlegeliana]|uniref:o-succinylbenzoate synthase n=1 Tax=Shewanella schlegeliana TaxID=190308 RepID=A0ABS1T1E2_9GAMM|nr:o-succinylbenzoate synthase [Shewanella schlegeliana]MBL4914607.1 o-succinylbenzoate synthase [Shewanella schlegeliana]MCL1109577.1 o-succinylbenzoate synthase [Shewanella schlegeliana]GIU29764.1 o-succinylbenzoate synthase [Shewanella schlegeliana]